MNSNIQYLWITYIDAGDVSGECNGMGDTHISSKGIFPALSIKPGVEVLLGNAAEIKYIINVTRDLKCGSSFWIL